MGVDDESGWKGIGQPSSDHEMIPRVDNQQMDASAEITEEVPHAYRPRSVDLVVEIPSSTPETVLEDCVKINIPTMRTSTPKRVNFSPMPSPYVEKSEASSSPSVSKERSSFKNLIPRLSFKLRTASSDIEKAVMVALGSSPSGPRTSVSRTFSLKKILSPKIDRATSLPITPISHSNQESSHGGNKGVVQASIHRSRSVPLFEKHGKLIDPVGGMFRVIPTPRAKERISTKEASPISADENDDDGEDIPEEEAVCRICFVELGEGSDTLKMECSCKGELALAHQECAVKWFSIKGNKICDICKQDVTNLPVTLLRIQNPDARVVQGNGVDPRNEFRFCVWQDIPVLVIVSMLGYFCFLEQLLVTKMGSGAIVLTLPFSCILGLLASMTSIVMGRPLDTRILSFDLLLIELQAVISILIATLVGFGITMCGVSIIVELLRWRRWQHPHLVQQRSRSVRFPVQSLEAVTVETQQSSSSEQRDDLSNQGSRH
ncbi:hypothetical protein AKJ16_DCAP07406 [Drosera capensis]